MTPLIINDHQISNVSPCYIIAEMSANHGGDYDKAIEIIHAAKKAGANAVKLQTYTASTITLDSDKEDFRLPSDNPWESHKTLFSLYEKAYTPWSWHKGLFDEGKKIGIDIFSSPFDLSAVELLEDLDCPVYKIASPEITDIPLIKRVAQTGKPIILSTGLSTIEDIELAVTTLKENGCSQYAFLKCTTAYPAPPEDINLKTIPDISDRFNCISGISDHSLNNSIAIAAIALGAKIIEKHFVLDKNDNSVDAFFSLTPKEFKELVDDVRCVEKALGKVDYTISPASQKNMLARRSLYVAKNIKVGDIITSDNVVSVRPSFGLSPKHYETILGKIVIKNAQKGDRFQWNLISNDNH
ncbi:MAG: pseudaminic acid synthase [Alteromonadaceae bacterium]|nr:pseudaminic acid synthase [Alteromonadaceae bacterium]